MNATLRLHPDDPLVIGLEELAKGDSVEGAVCQQEVPRGHKVATRLIAKGEMVTKFGHTIGTATADIEPGQWIHLHNLSPECAEPAFNQEKEPAFTSSSGLSFPVFDGQRRATALSRSLEFQGYRRADGRYGTRNMLGVLTTVNCSATVARLIGREVERREILDAFPSIDGVAILTHGSGCGMVPSGDGLANLERTLGGYARHPNFGGVLVLGLGCETNDLSSLFQRQGLSSSERLRGFAIQQVAGTGAAVERGVAEIAALAAVAGEDRRVTGSAGSLCLGLQCGGSDAYSALTANPALGVASDLLVAAGGTVILAETPEIFGAEHLLLARSADSRVASSLQERLDWWQQHARANGGALDNNPSPGNKKGGLTTILEKSLGAVAKAGSSPLRGVLRYGEIIDQRTDGGGLWFMDSPGFDPCSATGEIAAGANLLCFTTGRGSVSGFVPTPSVKLSTNTKLAEQMPEDIDLDCGRVLSGVSVEQCGREILDLLLRVASGEPTRSEGWGFGDAEFVPWVPGAVF